MQSIRRQEIPKKIGRNFRVLLSMFFLRGGLAVSLKSGMCGRILMRFTVIKTLQRGHWMKRMIYAYTCCTLRLYAGIHVGSGS